MRKRGVCPCRLHHARSRAWQSDVFGELGVRAALSSRRMLDEMDEDDLTDAHVRAAIMRGTVTQVLTDDPRGVRFVVRGPQAHAAVEVVCRFLSSGKMRIITVYRTED